MARVFKRKDRLSAMSEINITSLLDLVFCLLIIFMITTPLMEQSIKVNLPSMSHAPGPTPDAKPKFVAVSIDQAGNYYFEKNPVTLDQLHEEFKKLAVMPDPPTIALRGDDAVPYGKVAKVLAMIDELHLEKIGFDYQVSK